MVICKGIIPADWKSARISAICKNGPSGLDAQGWRHIFVSRNYGTAAKDLRSSIAAMARKLGTEKLEIHDDRLKLLKY